MMESELSPYEVVDLTGHRVLVLAPHPDDETFGCGGALALHQQSGDPVKVVFLTSGELGQWVGEQDSKATRDRREAEVREALSRLGVADFDFWRYPDRAVEADGELVARLEETLAASQPTLVYAPSPLDLHPDHRAVAHALRTVLRGWRGQLKVAFFEVSYPVPANALVDVTSVWSAKEGAMQAYSSQLAGPDHVGATTGLNQFRVLTLPERVSRAEAFRVLPAAELESDSLWRWQSLQEKAGPESQDPPVSVIVRTRDRPGLLREALGSLSLQTFKDFEVLVVNDGGQDVSEILADFSSLRISLLRLNPAKGRAAAANAGLKAARGDFVAYLDDDDLYYPNHLEHLYAFLSTHDHFGVAYTDANVVRLELNPENQRYEVVRRQIENSRDFDPDWLLHQNYIHNLCLMHRREAWEKVGGVDEGLDLLEDWDFLIRLAQDYPFYHLPKCTAEYRIRGDGTNVSEQRPWGRVEETAARAMLYRRHWTKRSPEKEVRVYDALVEDLMNSKEVLSRAREDLSRVREDLSAKELRQNEIKAELELLRDRLSQIDSKVERSRILRLLLRLV